MLDNKGRLFGKVNIVDLLIVIIIIAAGIFLGKMLFGPESTLAQTKKVTLTLYCEETPKYVAEQLEAGSEAWDAESNVTLGTLTEWRTGESVSAVTDITGQVVEISREDYCSVTLTVDGDGVIGDHGVTIGGTLYAAGHSMSVYFGDCKLFLKVRSVEAA